MVWARMTESDLAAALACDADIVHLSISVSDVQIERKLGRDRAWVLATLHRFVDAAADAGATVSVGFEDASRADADFLVQAAQLAQAHGAVRVRYADTLGLLEPFVTHERIARLRREIDIGIEMHAHNDLGLATANTLAAVLAGATHASTTVNGLGERAGNAALEEVVMGARHLYALDCGIDTTALQRISQLVAQASGRPVAAGKSIVGDAVFTHESGIHVDGLLKDRGTYEAFRPEELGRAHALVLGKHSGSHGVRHAYARLGMALSDTLARALLDSIRSHVAATKRAPTDEELIRFYLEAHDERHAWTA
jgi:homocitrate synthase NifV